MTEQTEQSAPQRPAAAAPAPGRVPDFFIVGHEKCGTTALDLMLREHPQIFLPEVKEQRFFAPELRAPQRDPSAHDGGRPRTLADYVKVFAAARPDQLVGESTPLYLRSHEAAGRIAAVQPEARIVAILREPASFLRSYHLQWVHNRVETERDLRKALALEPERREGRRLPRGRPIPQQLYYSDHVRYVEQLERYSSHFGRERILVLIYDDFQADNRAGARQVLRFLGLDESVELEPVRTRALKGVRSPLLKHLADVAREARRNRATASRLGRAIDTLTPAALHNPAFRARWRSLVYKPAPGPDEELMRELRVRFRGEVQAISDWLGRDLVREWGYDRID
jgi:Sulfotransferase domain